MYSVNKKNEHAFTTVAISCQINVFEYKSELPTRAGIVGVRKNQDKIYTISLLYTEYYQNISIEGI